jgi:putative PIN family toxin of toxin-antitoxin system
MQQVILDTNVFIAAAFNPRSSSARIIELAKEGKLQVVWDERTRAETEKMVTQIPPTRAKWPELRTVFREENKHMTAIEPSAFKHTVKDPDDRKFAALAADTGATIITNDDDLLGTKQQTRLEVVTPGEFVRQYRL